MNQKGFATTALLALLPLLLAIFALAAGAFLVLRSDGEARHVCRVSLLQAQEKVARDLKALLALNREAAVMRARRTAAEIKVKLAIHPVHQAQARAELQLVIAAQMMLSAKQKALIASAMKTSAMSPFGSRSEVDLHLRESQRRVSVYDRESPRTPHTPRYKVRPTVFRVLAEPANSPTPDYRVPKDFSDHQTMRVEWDVEIASLLPDWLSDFVVGHAFNRNLKLTATCAATLMKEDNSWSPRLKVDKL